VNDLAEAPIGRLLGIAGTMVARRFQRFLDDQGLSHAAFQVLLALDDDDGLTHRDVAERCYVTPATVTGAADALEREGLVTRERATDDRRVVRLHLTAAGRRRVRAARKAAGAEMAPVFGDLAPEDEAVVRAFLLTTVARLSEDGG
jgi:DNA-binding MarR family transcriptional regulator